MQTALSQRQLKRIRRKNRVRWSRQRLRLLKRRQSAQPISLSRRLYKQKQRLRQLTQQILMLLERKRRNQKRANKAKTLRRLQQRRLPAAVSCHFDEF
jgi:hypothetical protein